MPTPDRSGLRPDPRACLALLPCLLLVPWPAPASSDTTEQLTIGFTDRHDLGALLDYRLPDWGWRRWDADGFFHGSGHRESYAYYYRAGRRDQLDYYSRLTTNLAWYRESEARTWTLAAGLNGRWRKLRNADARWFRSASSLTGAYSVRAGLDQYVDDRPWFVGVTGEAFGSYEEIREDHGDWDWQRVSRGHSNGAQLDLGWGRLRDVTPLVRAQRLAERLVTLGRPRPEPAQIQAAARVLAQFGGYQQVFERPEHRFWERVLAPLIGDEPLTVAEVHYLRHVLSEDIGVRRQGLRAALSGLWSQDGWGDEARYQPGFMASVEASRNLALDLQVALQVFARWDWLRPRHDAGDNRLLTAQTQLALLWNVVDRSLLAWEITALTADQQDETISGVIRRVSSSWSWQVLIEDRASIRPFIILSWRENDSWYTSTPEFFDYSRAWSWMYGINLHYRLDGLLF